MEVLPTLPSAKGSTEMFTGEVHFDVIYKGNEPSRMRVNVVRFAPGARTAWHCHAVGQTLHVTEGIGLVHARGGELVMMRPGGHRLHPSWRMALARSRPGPLHEPPRHVGSTKP
jgi:quercetin dioxygenase-like cupin family protein